jgi:hypothetical protein
VDEFRDDLSQVVAVPIPAAGAGFTFKPSGTNYNRLHAVTFSLTTSATVADRCVLLAIKHGDGGVVAAIPSPALQTAASTDSYTFARGLYPYSVNSASAVVAPLPDLWLRLGDSIVVTVSNIDAGDTITNIRVVLDQVSFLEARGE